MRVVTKSKGLSPSYGQSPQKMSSPGHELTSPEKTTGKKSQSLAIFLNKGKIVLFL